MASGRSEQDDQVRVDALSANDPSGNRGNFTGEEVRVPSSSGKRWVVNTIARFEAKLGGDAAAGAKIVNPQPDCQRESSK